MSEFVLELTKKLGIEWKRRNTISRSWYLWSAFYFHGIMSRRILSTCQKESRASRYFNQISAALKKTKKTAVVYDRWRKWRFNASTLSTLKSKRGLFYYVNERGREELRERKREWGKERESYWERGREIEREGGSGRWRVSEKEIEGWKGRGRG